MVVRNLEMAPYMMPQQCFHVVIGLSRDSIATQSQEVAHWLLSSQTRDANQSTYTVIAE